MVIASPALTIIAGAFPGLAIEEAGPRAASGPL